MRSRLHFEKQNYKRLEEKNIRNDTVIEDLLLKEFGTLHRRRFGTAVTDEHRLTGIKQQKGILSQLWRQKS